MQVITTLRLLLGTQKLRCNMQQKNWLEKYRACGRNVTADNCFTSVELVKGFPRIYDLTYVGTDR